MEAQIGMIFQAQTKGSARNVNALDPAAVIAHPMEGAMASGPVEVCKFNSGRGAKSALLTCSRSLL
jgi:hypothetical protein